MFCAIPKTSTKADSVSSPEHSELPSEYQTYPGDGGQTLLAGGLGRLLVGCQLLQEGLDQVVQAEAFSVLQVLHHEVGETLHVPRRPGEAIELWLTLCSDCARNATGKSV